MGNPFAGVAGGGFLQHAVDLLERQAFRLRDQEVSVEKAADAEGPPDEEHFGAEVAFVLVDHVGGNDSDNLFEKSDCQPGMGFSSL